MSFPKIKHINDVLPHISGKTEFIHVEKDGYSVINYAVVSGPEQFDDPVCRECRGLIFDVYGKLISRPYHKFFNVNENDSSRFEKIDFSRPHVILDKIDGSMVRPFYVNNAIRWGTKMGITDTSMRAEVFVAKNPKYVEFVELVLAIGITPIFEWCSKQDKIVVDYPEDQLILTAMRSNDSGKYVTYDSMRKMAEIDNIPVVNAISNVDFNDPTALEKLHEMEDCEGVIIRFNDGDMYKIKTAWYVLRHKSKENITSEKNVIGYIVNDEVDDIVPFLIEDDAKRLEEFRHNVVLAIDETIDWHVQKVADIHSEFESRKDFAFAVPKRSDISPLVKSIVFAAWDDRENLLDTVTKHVYGYIRKNISTETKVENIRPLIGNLKWRY